MSDPIVVFDERLEPDATYFGPGFSLERRDMAQLEALAELTHLRTVSFCDFPLDEVGLAHVCAVPSIDNLSLQNTGVSNADLHLLAELPLLAYLRLKDNPQLSDACVKHLLPLERLVDLQVHETSITAPGLAPLAELRWLRDLCIDDETGSYAEVRELSRLLQRCEILIKGHGCFRAGEFQGNRGDWA